MKYFIIGASGSIGSELIPKLLKMNHEVVGLVKSVASEKKIQALGSKIIRGNINDYTSWIKEAEQADVLLQLGAVAPPKRSNRKWLEEGAMLNTKACQGLLEAAKSGGNCKSFITASGIYVIGNHDKQWVTEATTPKAHQLAQFWGPNEDYVHKAKSNGLNATVLRFGQVYGSNPEGTFGKFFLTMAEKNQFRYMGKGDNYYPFIHIDDAVDAIIKTSENSINEPLLHIVDDDPMQMKAAIGAMMEAFGQQAKSLPIWFAKLMAGSPMVDGFAGSYRSRNELAKESLGWSPKYASFKDEIEKVVLDFKKFR